MKVDAPLVVGSGAEALVEARHSGEALPLLPTASRALALPELLRMLGMQADLCPRARCQRAKTTGWGGLMATQRQSIAAGPPAARRRRRPRRGDADHDRRLPALLRRSLDPLAMRRDPADARRDPDHRRSWPRRRSAFRWSGRSPTKRSCCCLRSIRPSSGAGIGQALLDEFIASALAGGSHRLHLEVRDGNPADRALSRVRIFAGRPSPQLLSRAATAKLMTPSR